MQILGLYAFHGDSSAALVRDGQLVAAVEEERFNRIKHWAGRPVQAAYACLSGSAPDHIGIFRDPKAHVVRKLQLDEWCLGTGPKPDCLFQK